MQRSVRRRAAYAGCSAGCSPRARSRWPTARLARPRALSPAAARAPRPCPCFPGVLRVLGREGRVKQPAGLRELLLRVLRLCAPPPPSCVLQAAPVNEPGGDRARRRACTAPPLWRLRLGVRRQRHWQLRRLGRHWDWPLPSSPGASTHSSGSGASVLSLRLPQPQRRQSGLASQFAPPHRARSHSARRSRRRCRSAAHPSSDHFEAC